MEVFEIASRNVNHEPITKADGYKEMAIPLRSIATAYSDRWSDKYKATLEQARSKDMAWIYLIIAGLFEIGWAVGLKYTQEFTKFWPSAACIGAMIVSIDLLARSLKTIPIGTAYAIWTGIGAAGTAIFGMIFFNESREVLRLACIVLIIAGVMGLKIFSPGH